MEGVNKQRYFIPKEYSRSPTVATEVVLLSCITDKEKKRDAAIIDISSMFIQTQEETDNEMAVIKIVVILVDLLLEVYS